MASAAQEVAPDAGFVDELEVMTGEAVGLEIRPLSFVMRAAGAIIDAMTYLGLLALMALIINAIMKAGRMDTATTPAAMISAAVFCLVATPAVVETFTRGKSLGKLAVGGRIVRDDGGPISLRHAFIRSLTGVLEIFGTGGGIAAVTALLNQRSKRLGDLLAGTHCQNERMLRANPPVFGVPLELTAWATTADVARLPAGLARRVAQFLRQSSKLTTDSRERMAESLAREVCAFVSPIPSASAELFLGAVSAVRRDREFSGYILEAQRLERLKPALTALPHHFPQR